MADDTIEFSSRHLKKTPTHISKTLPDYFTRVTPKTRPVKRARRHSTESEQGEHTDCATQSKCQDLVEYITHSVSDAKRLKFGEDVSRGLPGLKLVSYGNILGPSSKTVDIYDTLRSQLDWKQEEIVVGGRSVRLPRHTCVNGATGLSYKFSGLTLQATGWHPLVQAIKNAVERLTKREYNFALCNFYRNGNDYIGKHSDDESMLVQDHSIASVSIGCTRTMYFSHKTDGSTRVAIPLTSGCLLEMKGDTQKHYYHHIPKSAGVTTGRISLTFRQCAHAN